MKKKSIKKSMKKKSIKKSKKRRITSMFSRPKGLGNQSTLLTVCNKKFGRISNGNVIFTCPICEKEHSIPSCFASTEVYYVPFTSNDGITHLHDKNLEYQDCICETTRKKIRLIKKHKCKNCNWYYPIECNDNAVIIDDDISGESDGKKKKNKRSKKRRITSMFSRPKGKGLLILKMLKTKSPQKVYNILKKKSIKSGKKTWTKLRTIRTFQKLHM